jgi:S-adenosylmethionine/arginine decarboxylase-like enzyme
MRNIEPQIYRQRLVIEARYTVKADREMVKNYLIGLAAELKMTIHPDIPEPIITSANGKANPIHDGYEGLIFWLESGSTIYIWEKFNFLTIDIYTCKKFDAQTAINYAKKTFQITEIEYQEI